MKNLNVVILTHNEIDTIKKCLKALCTYTKNFNLVVIENTSTDGTEQFLSRVENEYVNITVEFNKENNGVIEGRNQGYSIAQKKYPDAEYVMFIDCDQEVLPGWQESYMNLFDQKYDLIGCEAWKMRKKDFYPERKVSCSIDSFSYIGAGGMMVKNSVIEDIGLFDERYEKYYWEDPSFCFRAHQAGYKIGWNYKSSIIHQKHNLSLSGDRKKYFMKNWKKFQEKWKGYEIPVLKMD